MEANSSQISTDQIISAVHRLSLSELDRVFDRVLIEKAERKAVHLTSTESDLLSQIYQVLPSQLRERILKLREKRASHQIDEDEYLELTTLTDQAEIAHAKRVAAMVELAKFRGLTLPELMNQLLPSVIQTDAEYKRTVASMNKLAVKPQLSKEEDRLLDLLTALVEAYDQKHYAIPHATPAMVIRMLMQDRGLKNKDLEPVLGSSGVTSEVINGKRNPSKPQIKALAQFFNVSAELFVAY